MSIGPMGFAGNVAGTSLSQRTGSEVERTQQETSNQARAIASERKAESSSGVGETEGDQAASDRDADGQRIWEESPQSSGEPEQDETPQDRRSKDPDGLAGSQLDISG